jgi:hypothetical protein
MMVEVWKKVQPLNWLEKKFGRQTKKRRIFPESDSWMILQS